MILLLCGSCILVIGQLGTSLIIGKGGLVLRVGGGGVSLVGALAYSSQFGDKLEYELFTFGPLQVSFIHSTASDTARQTAQQFWRLFMSHVMSRLCFVTSPNRLSSS